MAQPLVGLQGVVAEPDGLIGHGVAPPAEGLAGLARPDNAFHVLLEVVAELLDGLARAVEFVADGDDAVMVRVLDHGLQFLVRHGVEVLDGRAHRRETRVFIAFGRDSGGHECCSSFPRLEVAVAV
ncbi:hypothetical protein [Streptomyces sp. NPDC008001]|uniref:hypothetical protein n=1 Tax=Streptomyces sp. NPDC008001 TaxID=3364804 RepID=UPI0036E3CA23